MNQKAMNQKGSAPRPDAREPTDEELRHAVPRGQRSRDFLVGVFVLLGLVSALTVLYLLTDPSTFRGRYRVYTVVEDAGGIRRGDPVQMRGVNVGRVMGFSLEPEGVVIDLEIEGRWTIPADSRSRLVSSGILGGRTVEILEGVGPEALRSGSRMPGEDVAGLLDFPPELGMEVQAVLGRIQDLLAEPTVDAIQASAQQLQTLLGQLSRLAEAQGGELERLTASLNRSAQGLEEAASSGGDLARAVARADSALLVVNRTSDVLLRASSSLEAILQRVESGEGTFGQLSTNPALYESLNDAARSIQLLADDIREHPGRYVRLAIF
jgi:phospholipid/cholesterol/gamma-HCH transport system substrate-binding protein